jgi:hypothetical protein
MKHLNSNKKKKNNSKATAAKVFSLAAILLVAIGVSTMAPLTALGSRSRGGEEEAVRTTTTTTTNNNVSNALLGRLVFYGEGEDIQTNVNPINETYIVVSYSGNRIILPPNATGIINVTETGNVTINIQPNGLSFNQGHAVIMTEGGAEEGGENATITFVSLTRTNPDSSVSGTSVTYFSTNSTGQLAFLDNVVTIGQIESSPEKGINGFAEWEWKGGTLSFENLLPQS